MSDRIPSDNLVRLLQVALEKYQVAHRQKVVLQQVFTACSIHHYLDVNGNYPRSRKEGARVVHLGLFVCLSGRVTKKTIAPIELILLHKKYYTRGSALR